MSRLRSIRRPPDELVAWAKPGAKPGDVGGFVVRSEPVEGAIRVAVTLKTKRAEAAGDLARALEALQRPAGDAPAVGS